MTDSAGRVRVVLAHGASGTAEQMQPHAEGLIARGFEAHAIDLPTRKAEAAIPVYRDVLAQLPPPRDGSRVAIGGQSYGGRVATLLVAEDPAGIDALVLFSYPLHAPGRSESWEARAAHLPRVALPALFLSGEADPLARIDLLREAAGRMPNATLRTWPGQGHWLGPVLDEALDATAEWLRARLG
jgi:predicted alpha/beta-hydrolase family hydrolase